MTIEAETAQKLYENYWEAILRSLPQAFEYKNIDELLLRKILKLAPTTDPQLLKPAIYALDYFLTLLARSEAERMIKGLKLPVAETEM